MAESVDHQIYTSTLSRVVSLIPCNPYDTLTIFHHTFQFFQLKTSVSSAGESNSNFNGDLLMTFYLVGL